MRKAVVVALCLLLFSSVAAAEVLVPKVDGIIVDGNLADWAGVEAIFIDSSLVADATDVQGDSDLSALAWLAYSADAFYLAARVTDDALVFERTGGDIWQNDCIELWINDKQNGLTINVNGENFIHSWGGLNTSEAKVTVVKEENGYVLEAMLPKSMVSSTLKLESGQAFKVAIGVDDADQSGGGRLGQIYFPEGWVWGQTSTFSDAVLE